MKTAKITQVSPNGTWTAKDGTVYFKFNIEFDNGDKGGILQKTETFTRKAGDTADYEIEDKNGHFNIRFARGQAAYGKGFISTEEQQKKELRIVRQSSLNRAVELAVSKMIDLDDTLLYADLFTSWVMGDVKAEKLTEAFSELPF